MDKTYSVNKAVKTFLEVLAKDHPTLFGASCSYPWKVGIHKDIIAAYRPLLEELAHRCMGKQDDLDAVINKIVSRALASKAKTPAYAWTLISNKVRYDLDGREAGEVSQEDHEDAERRLNKFKKRKAQGKTSASHSDVLVRNLRDAEYLERGLFAGALRAKTLHAKSNKEQPKFA